MRYGIMSVDPGDTTGLGFWILDDEQEDPIIAYSPNQWKLKKHPRDRSLYDPYLRTSKRLIDTWYRFVEYVCPKFYQVPPENVSMIWEDFILRPGTKLSRRSALAPVYITAQFNALMGDFSQFTLSNPSNLGAVTDGQLRKAGLWTVGMEHARDAARHGILHARSLRITGMIQARPSAPPRVRA